MADEGFLSRWSRLKTGAGARPAQAPRASVGAGPAAQPAATAPAAHGAASAPTAPAGAAVLPTLEDALRLDAASDYSAFVARGVDAAVRREALRRLFADPHFKTMDGLDVYIGDYTKADPVAPAMLASLRRAAGLLRGQESEAGEGGAPGAPGSRAQHGSTGQASPGEAGPANKENDEH